MKVLHVIPSLSPSLGGPPQVALNLVWALRECGIDAEIVTTNHDGPGYMDFPLNQRIEYQFGADKNLTVPVWFLPFQPPALKEFIFSSALTRWLWKHIEDYDVLDNHYLFSYAPTCAGVIARRKNIPYTVRTMGQLTPWALEQSRRKKQAYTFLIERHNLNQAAAIHCTTAAEAEDVRRFGIQAPTITLPLGVNSPILYADAKAQLRSQYNLPVHTPIILFLSRLHYKKRPELLLESLHQLKAKYNFYAILAGSGTPEYLTELNTLAESLGISDRVSFPGLITGKAKDVLLQGSDFFVLPSFSENFGIAVAEALVSGLPVIITPGIQIAEDVAAARAGLVVEGEVNDLTEAIEKLLVSTQLRSELGNNGKQLAQTRYCWKTIAQDLIPIYTSIAARKPLSRNVQYDSLSKG
ncbi:MAG TPA: glycosyltransferase [Trichocoleus sp.]|jgi:glycosyltransferase involved in cell wall biosynthesis